MTDDFSPDERELLDALATLPPIEPPGDLRDRFRLRAAGYRSVHRGPSRWLTAALAAVLVLVIAGGWRIDRQRHEVEATRLRTELTLALTNLSAVTRSQAVTTAGQAGVHDDRVAQVLVNVLLHDANTNVRVAAVEALGQIGSAATISSAAREALVHERSPFVQAALLGIAQRMSASDRVSVLHALLAKPDLDEMLRVEAARLAAL